MFLKTRRSEWTKSLSSLWKFIDCVTTSTGNRTIFHQQNELLWAGVLMVLLVGLGNFRNWRDLVSQWIWMAETAKRKSETNQTVKLLILLERLGDCDKIMAIVDDCVALPFPAPVEHSLCIQSNRTLIDFPVKWHTLAHIISLAVLLYSFAWSLPVNSILINPFVDWHEKSFSHWFYLGPFHFRNSKDLFAFPHLLDEFWLRAKHNKKERNEITIKLNDRQ